MAKSKVKASKPKNYLPSRSKERSVPTIGISSFQGESAGPGNSPGIAKPFKARYDEGYNKGWSEGYSKGFEDGFNSIYSAD